MINLPGDYDPEGVAKPNGNFLALPFTKQNAHLVLIPVPWDVTASFGDGTNSAPKLITEASLQIDLYDPEFEDVWKKGVYLLPDTEIKIGTETVYNLGVQLRPYVQKHILALASGDDIDRQKLKEINDACEALAVSIFEKAKLLLEEGKQVGIVGGDHSVPFGLLKALAEKHQEFGVLHLDAHFDLRQSYENFTYSHASIFSNASAIKEITKFLHVGIRDASTTEQNFVAGSGGRHIAVYEKQIRDDLYSGKTFHVVVKDIIDHLPQKVYISFDIDVLQQHLCPNTGTPVPGGLEFSEAAAIVSEVMKSGREIIGFDLCEVGAGEWDANVGARLLYKLCLLILQK